MMYATITFVLGLSIHLLSPLLILKFKSGYYKLYIRNQIIVPHPNYFYDCVTIIIALIMTFILKDVIQTVNWLTNIYGFLVAISIGAIFPLFFWKLKNRKVVFSFKNNFSIATSIFLPLSALSEEIIWRSIVPSFIIYMYNSNILLASFLGTFGFIILHWGYKGMKSTPYILIFTLVLLMIFFNFGFLASTMFHVVHNLMLETVQPIIKKNTNYKHRVTYSEEW